MTPVEDTALSISQQMIRLRKPIGPYERDEIGTVVDETLASLASLSPPTGARPHHRRARAAPRGDDRTRKYPL